MTRQLKGAKSRVLATSSLAALSLALPGMLGGAAIAQDDDQEAERIIVTGSRIQRQDFEASSPIVTVETDVFENRSSFNLEAALNQLPQFTPDGTQNAVPGNPANTFIAQADSAPGAATLNLRGLGSNRGLVLVNGRRPQPANAQLVVDINAIPSAAVDRVEVITGGAGAVYGADAIAGVTNFWLREDFEGLEADARYGVTEVGDNKESQVSVLLGGVFAEGRGNALAGAVWSQRGEALQRNRDFYTRGWRDPGTTGTFALNTYSEPAVVSTTIGGVTYVVNPDGTLFNMNDALDVATANPLAGVHKYPLNAGPGGSGFKLNPPTATGQQALVWVDPESVLSIPSDRYSIFSNARYEVTDSVTAFLEATFTNNYTSARTIPAYVGASWIINVPYNQANDDPDSPTFGDIPTHWHPVSAPLADLLNSRPQLTYCEFGSTLPNGAPCPISRATADPELIGTPHPNQPWVLQMPMPFLGYTLTNTRTETYQVNAGFEGDLGFRDWTWEAYGSHGLTHVWVYQPSGYADVEQIQHVFSGINPVTGDITTSGPWGEGWHNGQQFATVAGCLSGVPLFDETGAPVQPVEVTQDCIDYFNVEFNHVTEVEQNVVEASMQGGLLELPWSDEIRFALGATYRENSFFFNPDSNYAASKGFPQTITPSITFPLATVGSFDVAEVFGELLVPVVSDLPGVQNLELELGYRYSDYSTAGGVDTYKMLADWEVDDWLRFRGGYQRANRAPNLFELFSPIAPAGSFGAADPCSNIVGGVAGGSPEWGNVAANPNRVNVQELCAHLISLGNQDGGPGGFAYRTLLDDMREGVPLNEGQDEAAYGTMNDPTVFDPTHMSNFRWHQGFSANQYGGGGFGASTGLEQGNPDLSSEVAETWTAGAVLRSPVEHPLLDRLTLSLDWYQIDIQDTIATPSYIFVYQQCLDPQFNPVVAAPAGTVTREELFNGNPFCKNINRQPFAMATNAYGPNEYDVPGTGINRTYDAAFFNQGGIQTSGVDVQINWGADFADLGPLQAIPGGVNLTVLASFLSEWSVQGSTDSPWVDYMDTSSPECTCYQWRLFSTIGYNVGDASAGLRIRYLPEIGRDVDATAEVMQFPITSSTQVDLFGRWQLNETLELRGGVDNLLDEQPEVTGRTATNRALNSTNGQFYDTLGRRYFIGLTARY